MHSKTFLLYNQTTSVSYACDGATEAGFSTITRCLRSLQSLTNKHQIYISKRQLSDVSDL